jgi:hypothetical protein
MKSLKKAYKGTDVNMLTACTSIVKTAKENVAELTVKRPLWNAAYIDTLTASIHNAFTANVGIDKSKAVRQATIDSNKYCNNTYQYLTDIKVQLTEDYKTDKVRLKTILSELGYVSYHKHGRRPTKEDMIKWAYQFKTNMTTVMANELVAKGIIQASITYIADAADKIQLTYQTLNNLKINKPGLTQQNQAALNEIYKEVIGISKIARRIFSADKTLQALFSYNYTLKQMGAIKAAKPGNEEEDETDQSPDVNNIDTEI